MTDIAWDDYLQLLHSAEKLVETAERLIEGASGERPDEWGNGRDVWASDFEALELQVKATRTVLRETPTKPTTKGPSDESHRTDSRGNGTVETAN